ncbi:MAG TPA: hypothetical protein VHT01_10605 [Candidatus Udaeobacter sp.]|nr:hypothetical protein [Candidatus Udaeobacter sp.]
MIESKAGNSVRGIFPYAGKRLHLIDRLRKTSAISIHNRLCCSVEISRASVIAEALPRVQDLVLGGPSKRVEIWKRTQPVVIIRDDGGDLRLLEHELGNEDCVWIDRSAPREVAAMAAIPTRQTTAKSG